MALTRWRTQTLLGTSTANWNFTYLDNGNVNFPDNKKYSRSKPTIIRIPPTTLMPIRLTLLFFIILFAKTNSSAPTTIIKTDINGYMSFLLSNSDLLSRVYHTASRKTIPDAKKAGYRRYDDTLPLFLRMALTYIVPVRYCMNRGSANGAPAGGAFLVDIPTGAVAEVRGPDELRLLIFPQPLDGALKNQNTAPASPPCFRRRRWSAPLLFESCTVLL